jgi:hypothetical protein
MPRDRSARNAEIEQDIEHEKREWKIERVGWVIMAVLLLAALAGLLGTGPLSKAVAGDRASSLWVEYHRFERYQSPTKITIHVRSDNPHIRLWINDGFVRMVDLTHIDPEPDHVEAGSTRYTFPMTLTDTDKDIVVTVYFKTNEFGRMNTEIGLEEGPSLSFSQLVYP